MQTEAWKGPASVLANLKGVISRAARLHRSLAASPASASPPPGQIHPKTHAVVYAPNLEWENVPLRDEIESAFGLPVYVENDVRAAAWGEYRFGVGRGVQSLIARLRRHRRRLGRRGGRHPAPGREQCGRRAGPHPGRARRPALSPAASTAASRPMPRDAASRGGSRPRSRTAPRPCSPGDGRRPFARDGGARGARGRGRGRVRAPLWDDAERYLGQASPTTSRSSTRSSSSWAAA